MKVLRRVGMCKGGGKTSGKFSTNSNYLTLTWTIWGTVLTSGKFKSPQKLISFSSFVSMFFLSKIKRGVGGAKNWIYILTSVPMSNTTVSS